MTTSELSIGRLTTDIITCLGRRFIWKSAIAPTVPKAVEISAARKPTESVVPSAAMIASSVNSSRYHLSVKPPHCARDLLLLKE